MARSINKVILVGHTASQVCVTKFSVATSHRWKDQASGEWQEATQWTNVVLWRNDKLGQFLVKGKQVYVEGRLATRSYENADHQKVWITEVIADDVVLLGGGSGISDASEGGGGG